MRRRQDKVRIGLLLVAVVVAMGYPVINLWAAQTQEFINGSTAGAITALGSRIDKIESMINAVLVAMVINFVANIIQIRRTPDRRER